MSHSVRCANGMLLTAATWRHAVVICTCTLQPPAHIPPRALGAGMQLA